MYKKALSNLIERAAREFFKEKTGRTEVCCFKVELSHDETTVSFAASVVSCDNDPLHWEFFKVTGYLCYNIEFTKITDINGKELYNRWN